LCRWLPLSPAVAERFLGALERAPAALALRAGDGLHLACAAENGFCEVHSKDRRLLAAAGFFGLRGIDVTAPER
jgi:predicted nucleic acid-binding protein